MKPQSDLFQYAQSINRRLPLAEALRPKTLVDFLGQNNVINEETPLKNLIDQGRLASLIFWGPPGVGKTTLARILVSTADAHCIQLSAVSTGIKELREAISDAETQLGQFNRQTVIFIDEIHRYSKTQQDALLPYVENGLITLIGATTENPSFQVIPALLSRVLVVQFGYLDRTHIRALLKRGLKYLGNVKISQEGFDYLVNYANGDGRSALTLLDIAYQCAPDIQEEGFTKRAITLQFLEHLAQQNRLNYDREGDEHYDHASAFQKSLRGSDPNAAIYWLAKMIAGGEDPRFIARRLVITAAEDVGLADPMALVLANTAAQTVERIGLPEGRIPLAQATIYVANAPKSNTAICAIDAALSDIQHQGKSYPVPKHLKDSHYSDAKTLYGHGKGYIYSHDHPEAPQTFLPDELVGTEYVSSENKK